MNELWILGPGASLSHYTKELENLRDTSVMAFQNVFPHCVTHFKIIPQYWFSADPNAWMGGFEFLCGLTPSEQEKYKQMKILIPQYAATSFAEFRLFAGTTPLGRQPGGWERYLWLLGQLKNAGFNIEIIPCTTTKRIHSTSELTDQDLFGETAYRRFMHHEPVLGTVAFDSESVLGERFKWGLENKLSSAVFPIAYYLGFKKLYIGGFDLKGPRFYSSDTRHPWNDETQNEDVHRFPLGLIKRWLEWAPLHGMELYSVVDPAQTLLSEALPTRLMGEILNG